MSIMPSMPLRVHSPEQIVLGDPAGHFFGKLSLEILASREFNPPEKIVLVAIESLLNRASGICSASNGKIGQTCGMPGKTVERIVCSLGRKNAILRDFDDGQRQIRLNFGFRGRADRPVVSPLTPPKLEGSNTSQTSPKMGDGPPPVGTVPSKMGDGPPPVGTILRLGDSKADLVLDSGSASAGRGTAPPPPTPKRTDQSDLGTPSAADLLTSAELAETERLANVAGARSFAHALARISLMKHNRAIAAGYGPIYDVGGGPVGALATEKTGLGSAVEVGPNPVGKSLMDTNQSNPALV